MTDARPLVSIICPVFNEEVCVPLFFQRLQAMLSLLWTSFEFELIFTNNASTDRTLEKIREIRAANSWVRVVSLSRNFGYQASIMCGLRNAAGEAIIFIDVDCEDPPEMIPQFLSGWRAGNDVVYGRRTKRPEHPTMILARKFFYRFTRAIADSDFNLDMAEFALISRRVKAVCLHNRSSFPFVRTEIAYAGFRQFGIAYNRAPRVAGRTHYNLFRMARFAIAGILSTSTFPLRFTAYIGLPLALINALMMLADMLAGPFRLQPLLLLDMAALLVAVVGLSLFVARIYKDLIQRPLYIVDKTNTALDRPVIEDLAMID